MHLIRFLLGLTPGPLAVRIKGRGKGCFPTFSESSAQQLMARDQIMMNSVQEVLEIDGETVLIVHDDDNDDDDDE